MKNNLRGIFVNAYKMLILEWLKLFITIRIERNEMFVN